MSDLLLTTRISRPAVNGTLTLPNNRQLTRLEAMGLASIYWPGSEILNAVNVATAESALWTGAWNTAAEDSRGLWQISVEYHPQYGLYDLGDAQINAYWAYQIWLTSGWCAWSTAPALGLCPAVDRNAFSCGDISGSFRATWLARFQAARER